MGDAPGSVKESDVDQEHLITDQGVQYPASGFYGYYYPGWLQLIKDAILVPYLIYLFVYLCFHILR